MKLDLSLLRNLDSSQWPPGAGQILLDSLRERTVKAEDRFLAAELAGDLVVMNNEIAKALLAIVQNPAEPEALRSRVAIAFGPVLELADTDGFEDGDAVPITETLFDRINRALRDIYADVRNPKDLRRRALEASVRAPQEWHRAAVLEAYGSRDSDWSLTAVFCMGYVGGFEAQIVEALSSKREDLVHEAIVAADNSGVDGAWPFVARLVSDPNTPKRLLLPAISAVASIRPEEAVDLLEDLTEAKDQEVVDAAEEAIAMAAALTEDEDGDDDADEDDDDDDADEDDDDDDADEDDDDDDDDDADEDDDDDADEDDDEEE